jgi:hypothetical protein
MNALLVSLLESKCFLWFVWAFCLFNTSVLSFFLIAFVLFISSLGNVL